MKSNKKHIWIFNQTAGTPESGWGERHYFLSKHWVKKNCEVTIFSGSYNHLFSQQPKHIKRTFTIEKFGDNIQFCWVKIRKYKGESVFKLWSMIVFALKLLFIPKSNFKTPEVIIISSMPLFSILPAYFMSRRYKAKLIFEVRDLWPETPRHLKGYSKYHPMILVMAWLEKFGYRKADHIVSVLPNAYHYINRLSKQPEKFNYIPNGTDIELQKHEELPENIRLQLKTDKFTIGYAGTIGMANAMEFFIEASKLVSHRNDIHFILVGDGYLKERFMEETKAQKNISFIPKVKKSQVQSVLSYFDVCYVGRYNSPLYKHGVSYNKYFDYMLAKKPVLESSAHIKDPVELSNCGIIVAPEDAEAITSGILKFKELSTAELDKYGANGYNYVKKYHTFEYLSTQYSKLF